MLKKILVALDGSAISQKVFDQALTIARAIEAEVMLLHVLFDDEEGHPLIAFLNSSAPFNAKSSQTLQQQWQAYQTEWEARLQSYVDQAAAVGVKAESTQSYGKPGFVICDWARTWDADLIVLGRQGRSQVSAWRMGSVSTYVSQHAPCSVLMVSSQPQQGPKPPVTHTLVEV